MRGEGTAPEMLSVRQPMRKCGPPAPPVVAFRSEIKARRHLLRARHEHNACAIFLLAFQGTLEQIGDAAIGKS